MRYALSVMDLPFDNLTISLLVSPVIPSRIMERVRSGEPDTTIVVLECDEERATSIIAVLERKMAGRIRAYTSQGKSWKPVPRNLI